MLFGTFSGAPASKVELREVTFRLKPHLDPTMDGRGDRFSFTLPS
jgi:hypothetical protein